MSDDFGTVNVRRGDRAREIEVLRQHYRTHRDTLVRLIGDAPTEALAAEYQRLIAGIDDSLRKLDELERGAPAAAAPPSPPPPRTTSPGMRPLTMPGAPAAAASVSPAAEPVVEPQYAEPPAPNTALRTMIIVIGGIIVLAAIGYLIWRASSDRKHPNTIGVVEQPVGSTAAPATAAPVTPDTAAPAPAASALKISPALQDYGVIRKGTRAVRQFEAINSGSTPIEFQVARSACRCLFYDYRGKLAPKSKETVTVTIDGAKAKAGQLEEQLAVTSKKDPSVSATIGIRAVIQ